jgi:multiple sugar transport system substrate-binding protein
VAGASVRSCDDDTPARRSAVALLFVLATIGCARETADAPKDVPQSPVIQLSVNAVLGGKASLNARWLLEMAPRISRELTAAGRPVDVRILTDGGADESFKARLVLDLSGGTGPDIYAFDGFWTAEMASAGLLYPLDEHLRAWSDWPLYLPSMQRMGEYDGHTYVVPLGTDVRGIYYRKDLFEQAGLPREWRPRSWADIFAAGEALKTLQGVVPMQWNGGTSFGEATTLQGFYMALLSAGGDLYDRSAHRWVAGGDPLRHAFEFYREVYVVRGLADVGLQLDSKGRERSFEWFRDGKIGMYPEGTYMWQSVLKPGATWGIANRDDVVGWAPMPLRLQSDEVVSISGGGGYIINKSAPDKELAWAVLRALMSAESLSRKREIDPFIPTRRDLLESKGFKADAQLARQVGEALPVTRFRPGFPVYPRVSELVQRITERVVQGLPVDEALAAYRDELEDLVGKEHIGAAR